MKAKDIVEHFLSRSDWVNRGSTVDRVIIGDPEADFDRCIVTWMPNFRALRYMVDKGYQLMICHEPTFWNHRDEDPRDDPAGQDKRRYIEGHGIVIIRNHDCWDRWPDTGIPWAWASFLGLGSKPERVGASGYQHRYDIAPTPLDKLAARVASKCGHIGEPSVQVTGYADTPVSRIGIGTGCGCDIKAYVEMGCDCSVVCDDGSCYWSGIQRAEDMGHPVIRVNHGTSEEPGMVTLTQYINSHVPGLRAEHVPHGSTFRLVNGSDGRP